MDIDTNVEKMIEDPNFFSSIALTRYFYNSAFLMTRTNHVDFSSLDFPVIKPNVSQTAVTIAYETDTGVRYKIQVNSEFSLVKDLPAKDKFLAIGGMFTHELAHWLFTDFRNNKKLTNAIRKGFLFPSVQNLTPEEKDNVLEIENFLKHPEAKIEISREILNLANILEDSYIEKYFIYRYPYGILSNCLLRLRDLQSEEFENIEKDEKKEKASIPILFENDLLAYAKFSIIPKGKDAASERIEQNKAIIENAISLTVPIKRFAEQLHLYIAVWPLYKNVVETAIKRHKILSAMPKGALPEGINPSGCHDTNNTTVSRIPVSLPDISQKSKNASQSSASSETSKNDNSQANGTKNNSKDSEQKADGISKLGGPINPNSSNPQKFDSADKPDDLTFYSGEIVDVFSHPAFKAQFNKLTEEWDKEVNFKKKGREIESQEDILAQKISELSSAKCSDIFVHHFFQSQIQHEMESEYANIKKKMMPTIDRTVTEIQQRFKKHQGRILYNQYFGTKFNSSRVYLNDGKYFSKKILPSQPNSVAVIWLVDESGSMSGHKISIAKMTSVMMWEIFHAVHFPLCVLGHNVSTQKNGTDIFVYQNFQETNKKEAMCFMHASGCNRDGVALRYAVELIKQRPEHTKLIFIMSDGQPSAPGYEGQIAIKDIKGVCKEAEDSGVIIYPVAIDDDKQSIFEIYGKDKSRWINISDIQKVPEQILGALLRYIH